jgi:hypothetical protein
MISNIKINDVEEASDGLTLVSKVEPGSELLVSRGIYFIETVVLILEEEDLY